MRSLVYIYICGMEKKKLLTQIGTISLMHMLCMFRLIIEVKTKPKYITNCLLCVHLPVILYSIEKIIIIEKDISTKAFSFVLLAILNISCLSRDSNSIFDNFFSLRLSYISTHHHENEEKRAIQIFIYWRCDMIDWMDRWNIGTFSFSFFIDFGQLNFVWSALFLFTIYFLLLIRCSLVRARPSSSPCVQALRKRVKSLRSNDIFTFQRFFLLYLLGYQFILSPLSLSLPVRREKMVSAPDR